MKYVNILLFIILHSCATTKQAAKNNPSTLLDTEVQIKKCDKGDGLACSKLGFYYKKNGNIPKALEFNKKGCDLKDKSACFNLENLEISNKYDLAVSAKVQFYGQESW